MSFDLEGHISPFLDLLEKVIPAASPDDVQQARRDLLAFRNEPTRIYDAVTKTPFQADVVGRLAMSVLATDPDGNPAFAKRETDALILSTSCDLDNKLFITFAAAYEEQDFIKRREFNATQIADLKANTIAQALYLPHPAGPDYVVDFSETFSVETALFHKLLSQGRVTIKRRLKDLGHRLFLLKLAYFYFRPELEDPLPRNNRAKSHP